MYSYVLYCLKNYFGFRLESGWIQLQTLKQNVKNPKTLYDEHSPLWDLLKKEKKPFDFLANIEKTLLQFDLSRNEIKVYLHLARTGTQKARDISDALSLHRTETYRILRDLEKRGLVSCIWDKPIKFIAVPFSDAYDILIKTKKVNIQILERKKKNLVDLWSSIPKQKTDLEIKEIFQIFEGEEQLILKANEISSKTKKEICIVVSDMELTRLYHSGFTDNLEKISKKKVKVHLLTNNSIKSQFLKEKIGMINIKHISMKSEEMPNFILADNQDLLFSIKNSNDNQDSGLSKKEEKNSFLCTNYSTFINLFKLLFTNLWKQSSLLETD